MKRCKECSEIENDDAAACSACLHSRFIAEPPIVVDGRYEVTGKIGRGSMGIVYRARDLGLRRDVAIKIIAPMLARDPGMVDRFRREARALAAIRDDHVVQVYSFGPYGRSLYFAMEFIDAVPLDSILAAYRAHGAALPVDRALTILHQVGMGLTAAHARGVVHRDVKPGNVLIERDTGRPVVIDFGLAHWSLPGSGAKTMRSGTPSYMAPEQSSSVVLDGDALTARTDVYALACTAFEMLAGETPFGSAEAHVIWRRHVTALAPALSVRRPDLAPLDAALARALEKDPAARFATCDDFARALVKAAALDGELPAGEPQAAPFSSAAPRPVVRVLVVARDEESAHRMSAAVQAAARRKASVEVATILAGAADAARRLPRVVLIDLDAFGYEALSFLSALRAQSAAGSSHVIVFGAAAPAAEHWRFDAYGIRDLLAPADDVESLEVTLRALGERVGWLTTRDG